MIEKSELEEEMKLDLKRYKGHHRKFPWALIIRIVVALVTIGILLLLFESLSDLKVNDAINDSNEEFTIEVDY